MAVCTLTDQDLTERVAREAGPEVAIAGTLQSENLGIERLIRNLVGSGSPMLAVYASLLGTALLPFAKPFVAAMSTVLVAAAWWWMSRASKAAERRVDGTSCADPCA